jgi:hypothetical protein
MEMKPQSASRQEELQPEDKEAQAATEEQAAMPMAAPVLEPQPQLTSKRRGQA